MRDWLPKCNQYLRILLECEGYSGGRHCSLCNEVDAQWRCTDCLGGPILCTKCCQTGHARLPFHRIEKWTGTFFAPSSLHACGYILHLGHGGSPCNISETLPTAYGPLPTQEPPPSNLLSDRIFPSSQLIDLSTPAASETQMVIVDYSGVHTHCIRWCQCPNADPKDIQLLKMKLYPLSYESPRTAFTTQVLDDFLIDNLECKTSASNYYNKLRRITSNAFPHSIPVSSIFIRVY